MIPIHDVLVHLGAPVDVVGLDREHLLQGVGGAIGFQRPDLHLTEALTAELRLAAQGLLRDQAVGTGRTGVHLVVDQVVELDHVHVAHSDRTLELVAGAPVEQNGLAARNALFGVVAVGELEHRLDLFLGCTVEDRRGQRHASGQMARQLQDLVIGETRQILLLAAGVVDLLQEGTQFADRRLALQHAPDLLAQTLSRPTEMGLQHLTDVHARGHAERVQDDVDRHAVGRERHILDRDHLGDDTLVTVTTGHFVTGLDAALHGHIDLDHLEHAGRQIVTAGDLALLDLVALAEFLALLFDLGGDGFELGGGVLVTHADLEPGIARTLGLERVEIVLGDLGTGTETARTAVGDLAHQELLDTLEGVVLHDALLVGEVLAHALQFHLLDLDGALVLVHAVAGEDLDVDHGAVHARGQTQRGVLHVGGFLTEDGAQQLLFRGQLGLALGRDLADQDVAVAHLGADIDDAGFVELGERRLTHVRDVARDLLRPELGIARQTGQLLDMDGGEAILLHHALRDQDRVLEVVAVPGHEGHAQVLTQGQLAHVGRGTVGQDVAARDRITQLDQRTLIDTGVLVGAGVLGQVVDVDARHIRGLGRLVVVDAHHDTRGIDRFDDAAAPRNHAHARVTRHHALHAGADQGLLGAQRRHGLTLHVRAHEGAVSVVVLQERDQRSGHRDDLTRRDVHVLDFLGRAHGELVGMTAGDQRVGESAVLVQGRVGLGDDEVALFDRRQIVDAVGDAPVLDLAIGRLQEAVGVGAGIDRQRVDQTDVRTFRGLDRADAAIVGRVHVAHLEAGPLARQTAGAERRDAPLVRDLGQRVVLVHELRELRGTEELLDCRRHRLGVNEFLRHQALGLGQRQTLLDRALDAHQTDAELVLGHLADAADAAVAQMVDVVDRAATVAQLDQHLERVDDVRAVLAVLVEELLGEIIGAGGEIAPVIDDARPRLVGATEPAVELHATDRREIVAIGGEEQVVEQILGGLLGRRLAGAHHAIDLDLGVQIVGRRIDAQGLGDVRPLIEIVDEQGLQGLDALAEQGLQQLGRDRIIGLGEDLAGVAVDLGVRQDAPEQEVRRYFQPIDAGFLQLADVTRGHAPAGFDQHLVADLHIEADGLAAQTLGDQIQGDGLALEAEDVGLEEAPEDVLDAIAERAQQHRSRQFAPTVDAHEDVVLGVELEVEPGAAIGNDARREQQLARGMGLALVMIEEDTGRTVQLRDDDALGAVDDEGAGLGHERQFAHVDFLLAHVLDDLGAGRSVLVVDHQPQQHAQGRGKGRAAQMTLALVEHWIAQAILDILQDGVARVALDGEHGLEGRMQPEIPAVLDRHIGLQELAIGVDLRRQQERDVQDTGTLAEVFADALLFGERIGHYAFPRDACVGP